MRILASNFGLTIGLVVGLGALGSCSIARADFVPVNSDDINLATFVAQSDSENGMASSVTPSDRDSKDDPLTPSSDKNGPIVGRDLVSLFSLADGRGNQSGGAGSSNAGPDFGGIGQACVSSNSPLQNSILLMGHAITQSDSRCPDPIASRLFRPPRKF